MWQSAQARPFAPNPSSFRSKNARKPRATASQGSAPQCSLPALINNVDVNTRPPATSHVDLFTDSLRSVKRKGAVKTWTLIRLSRALQAEKTGSYLKNLPLV